MNVQDIQTANLATARSVYEAFGRGDVQAILDSCAPNIQWHSGGTREDFPVFGPRSGLEGVKSFFKDVAENNQFSLFEPKDFLASGDKVVVTGHYTMTQKKTGKPVDSDWAHIFTFRGGKCVAWRELNDSTAFYKAYR
jgi:ketosteroid isomerase-like protein